MVKLMAHALPVTGFVLWLFTCVTLFSPRLIAVGEEFCRSGSEDLHESIRKQTVQYFKTYHRSRMDELRMFLENDAWELCPVKASFKIVDLSVSNKGNWLSQSGDAFRTF